MKKETKKLLAGLIGASVGNVYGYPVRKMSREALKVEPVEYIRINDATNDKGIWSKDISFVLALMDSYTKPKRKRKKKYLNNLKDVIEAGKFTSTGNTGSISDIYKSNTYDCHILPQSLITGFLLKNFSTSKKEIAFIEDYFGIVSEKKRYEVAIHLSSKVFESLFNDEKMSKEEIYKEIAHEFSSFGDYDIPKGLKRTYARFSSCEYNLINDIYVNTGNDINNVFLASLWAFLVTDNFTDAVKCASNLGGESDTIASLTGAYAGVYYGLDKIPEDDLLDLKGLHILLNTGKDFAESKIKL